MNVQQGHIIVIPMQHVQTLLEILPVLVIQDIMVMVHHAQVRKTYRDNFIILSDHHHALKEVKIEDLILVQLFDHK
jgi:diadenosine tetraphosphate (Ap4A) HIT family hydrolase